MSSSPQVTLVRVLSASADPGLSASRELLLRQHGFEVATSLSKAHARHLIRSRPFDLLIFGNSLTAETCIELATIFRVQNPRGRIIEILAGPSSTPMNQPDATVVGIAGPEALLATIRAQLERR